MRSSNFAFGKDSDALFKAILSLKDTGECQLFFRDLCTLSELKSMTERWRTVEEVNQGTPYRSISKKVGSSTATITRVAYWLTNGTGGYKLALDRTHHS